MSSELVGVGIVSGASPTIAIGRTHLLAPSELETRHYAIERKDVMHEVARLNNAFLAGSRRDRRSWPSASRRRRPARYAPSSTCTG